MAFWNWLKKLFKIHQTKKLNESNKKYFNTEVLVNFLKNDKPNINLYSFSPSVEYEELNFNKLYFFKNHSGLKVTHIKKLYSDFFDYSGIPYNGILNPDNLKFDKMIIFDNFKSSQNKVDMFLISENYDCICTFNNGIVLFDNEFRHDLLGIIDLHKR